MSCYGQFDELFHVLLRCALRARRPVRLCSPPGWRYSRGLGRKGCGLLEAAMTKEEEPDGESEDGLTVKVGGCAAVEGSRACVGGVAWGPEERTRVVCNGSACDGGALLRCQAGKVRLGALVSGSGKREEGCAKGGRLSATRHDRVA